MMCKSAGPAPNRAMSATTKMFLPAVSLLDDRNAQDTGESLLLVIQRPVRLLF